MSPVRARTLLWLLLLPLAVGTWLRSEHARALYGVYMPHADQEEGYYEAGVSLLSRHALSIIPDVKPTAFRGPLYPALIAMIEAPYAELHPGHVRVVQAALSSLSLLAVFALAGALFGPLAGLLAATGAALDPTQIMAVTDLNVHGFYGLCLLAVAGAAAYWAQRPTAAATALLGAALGASLLCRSAHFPLPLLLAGACVLWRRPRGTLALLAATVLLALAPMALRNAVQLGRFVLLDTHKGSYILLRGSAGPYVTTTAEQAFEVAESLEPGFTARRLSGSALHEELLRLARRNILDHPLRFARYCLQRLWSFWSGLWYLLLPAAFALWRRRGEKRAATAVALVALSLSGYGVAGGAPEYRVSALPVLWVLAGGGLALLLRRGEAPADAPGRWQLAPAAGLLAVYAVMVVYLGLEWRDRRPGAPADYDDGRALGVLRLAAEKSAARSVAREVYVEALLQEAARARGRGEAERAGALLARAFRANGSRATRAQPERLRPIEPDRTLWHVQRALEDLRRGRRSRARAELARALEARPENLEALGLMTRLLSEEGRTGEALVYADRLALAARRAPGAERAQALVQRAGVLRAQGRLEAARADLEAALQADPRSWPAALELAGLLCLLGRETEALALLAGGETSAQRSAARAFVRMRLGDLDGARADAEAAAAADPKTACEARPGLLEPSRIALFWFDRCLELRPDDPGLLSDRGVARFVAGDAEGARVDLARALALAPSRLETALSLAAVLEGLGRGSEAAAPLDAALSRGEGDARLRAKARETLSRLARSRGG